MDLGPVEIALVLVVVLMLFGGTRIAEIGGSLGKGIREFRNAIKDDDAGPPAAEPELSAGGPRCGTCSAVNAPGARFCADCGNSLEQ